jgi:hypothetical protein
MGQELSELYKWDGSVRAGSIDPKREEREGEPITLTLKRY